LQKLTCVLVAADQENEDFWQTVRRVLCEYYSTLLIRKRRIYAPAAPSGLMVLDAAAFDTVACDDMVILYKDPVAFSPRLTPGRQTLAVVDSCDGAVMRQVSETKLPAITCGLSSRDTITLSSIDVDSAVINLQRSVTCFDGSVLEPQEIPVRLGAAIDNYALMALACVFILNGDARRLSKIYL